MAKTIIIDGVEYVRKDDVQQTPPIIVRSMKPRPNSFCLPIDESTGEVGYMPLTEKQLAEKSRMLAEPYKNLSEAEIDAIVIAGTGVKPAVQQTPKKIGFTGGN